MPIGATTFADALRTGSEIFHALKAGLQRRGLATGVGDEGGFAPNLKSNQEAIELVLQAVADAGFTAGRDVYLALDVAASELWDQGPSRTTTSLTKSGGGTKTADDLVGLYAEWIAQYPIASIEDGLSEQDWSGWQLLTRELGATVQLVGDDVFVTNPDILRRRHRRRRRQRPARQAEPDRHADRNAPGDGPGERGRLRVDCFPSVG